MGLRVFLLDLGLLERVLDVERAGVEPAPVPPPLVLRLLVVTVGVGSWHLAPRRPVVDVALNGEGLGVKGGFPAGANLFIYPDRDLGHVESSLDLDSVFIDPPGADLGHVLAAVDLLVVGRELVVVIGLQGELGAAHHAPEAAAVEECVVLQRADLVGGVDHLPAPQAVGVHVVRFEHVGGGGAGPAKLLRITGPSHHGPAPLRNFTVTIQFCCQQSAAGLVRARVPRLCNNQRSEMSGYLYTEITTYRCQVTGVHRSQH